MIYRRFIEYDESTSWNDFPPKFGVWKNLEFIQKRNMSGMARVGEKRK